MIQQVVVQLAVAIDLATVVPGFADQMGLPGILPSPLAQRTLLPRVETAGLQGEATARCSHAKAIAMLGNECVSHFASLAVRGGFM